MKEYVILKKQNDKNQYLFDKASTVEMCILGCFLASDVDDSASEFSNGVFDNQYPIIGGNLTYIEKENDHIILSNQYSEQPDGGPYFKIQKDEFLRLLDMWEKVYQQKPQEITIAYNGQKFSIETK